MRPLRLIFLLLTVGAALAVALIRPLPGHAGGGPGYARRSAGKHARKTARPRFEHMQHMRDRMLAVPRARPPFGRRVVSYARHFLGVPYSYGGTSPSTGFDCSGLVRYVYAHFGISLPHSSFADLWQGRRISRGGLRPGDLVFFGGASHVGIYAGGNRFIDAPHSGSVVRVSTMANGWYGTTYDGARRLRRG